MNLAVWFSMLLSVRCFCERTLTKLLFLFYLLLSFSFFANEINNHDEDSIRGKVYVLNDVKIFSNDNGFNALIENSDIKVINVKSKEILKIKNKRLNKLEGKGERVVKKHIIAKKSIKVFIKEGLPKEIFNLINNNSKCANVQLKKYKYLNLKAILSNRIKISLYSITLIHDFRFFFSDNNLYYTIYSRPPPII